jgi:hypothetical protein
MLHRPVLRRSARFCGSCESVEIDTDDIAGLRSDLTAFQRVHNSATCNRHGGRCKKERCNRHGGRCNVQQTLCATTQLAKDKVRDATCNRHGGRCKKERCDRHHARCKVQQTRCAMQRATDAVRNNATCNRHRSTLAARSDVTAVRPVLVVSYRSLIANTKSRTDASCTKSSDIGAARHCPSYTAAAALAFAARCLTQYCM